MRIRRGIVARRTKSNPSASRIEITLPAGTTATGARSRECPGEQPRPEAARPRAGPRPSRNGLIRAAPALIHGGGIGPFTVNNQNVHGRPHGPRQFYAVNVHDCAGPPLMPPDIPSGDVVRLMLIRGLKRGHPSVHASGPCANCSDRNAPRLGIRPAHECERHRGAGAHRRSLRDRSTLPDDRESAPRVRLTIRARGTVGADARPTP